MRVTSKGQVTIPIEIRNQLDIGPDTEIAFEVVGEVGSSARSVAFGRVEDLDLALPQPEWLRLPLPWSAAFLAGRVFGDYRRRGGPRPRPLPDFYTGAHAAVEGLTVVTRDAARFRTCFPTARLVTPDVGAP